MKRLLPAPLLSLALVALWLGLNHAFNLRQLLLGLILGFGLPLLLAPLRPVVPRVRHPWVLLKLIAVVGWDVMASNIMVLRTVMAGVRVPEHSGFVRIPLQLRDPTGLAALAMITTVVPGTVWFELAPDASAVRLHVWHAPDADAFIAHYKQRYELPLIRIFES